MRRAARTDTNQARVIAALRGVGCAVHDTSRLGGGYPDITVRLPPRAGGNRLWLVEIKDGSRPPSERQLTPAEAFFHDQFKPYAIVIESVDQAVEWATGVTA